MVPEVLDVEPSSTSWMRQLQGKVLLFGSAQAVTTASLSTLQDQTRLPDCAGPYRPVANNAMVCYPSSWKVLPTDKSTTTEALTEDRQDALHRFLILLLCASLISLGPSSPARLRLRGRTTSSPSPASPIWSFF